MAAYTSTKSGLWSDSTVWGGTPTSADTVTIAHTSTAGWSNTTNTAGYATSSTVITLATASGTYVVNEAVQFGTDPNYYNVAGWNSGTKVLTLSTGLLVAIPAAATTVYARGHVVTLDGAGACLSLTVKGTLKASTTANTSITSQTSFFMDNNSYPYVDINLSASPTYSCEIIMNAVRGAGSSARLTCYRQGSLTLNGWPRKRRTTLTTDVAVASTGTQSCNVTDASGWQAGDQIAFATTQAYNATPRTDKVTLTSVSGNTVYWDAAVTPTSFTHLTGGYVGNFSSNVVFRPQTALDPTSLSFDFGFASGTFGDKTIANVLFSGIRSEGSQSFAAFGVISNDVSAFAQDIKVNPTDCAFWNFSGIAFMQSNASLRTNLYNTVFYTENNNYLSFQNAAIDSIAGSSAGVISGCGVFRNTGTQTGSGIGNYLYGTSSDIGLTISDTFVSACNGVGLGMKGSNLVYTDLEIFSCGVGIYNGSGAYVGTRVNNGTFTATGGSACTNNTSDTENKLTVATLTDSKTQSLSLTSLNSALDGHAFTFVNKGSDVTQQEIYRPFMHVKRENTTKYRSTSSVSIYPTRTATNCTRTVSIPCTAGASVTIVGWIQKSNANITTCSVVLSGLGFVSGTGSPASPINSTATATWEKYTITATNSSGVDGNFTLTYTAAASTTASSGTAYFDGVPDSPFVVKCRHYGYTFDEANPVRTVNGTIQQATEATAYAYTGISIAGSTGLSPVTLTASKVFQDVYDYSQAYACANLTYTPSFTATGSAGTPALIALANVTTTGFTLNGGGTLAMGAYTLTATGYTYTGGTFAQASTVPSFTGGTLALGAAGAFTLSLSSGILQMTPTAPSTYNFSTSAFSGTIDLRNTAAHAITVSVPSGATFITTNNTGGAITVSAPTVNQTVTITGFTAGSRIQIYDYSTAAPVGSRELFNGTVTGGNAVITGSTCVWTDPLAAVATRDIRVRIAYVSGATAKEFIEANIGTCGTTAPSNAITYLADQRNDSTYNSNAVNGSAVTGITFTDSAIDLVNCNIAGGAVTWPTIYAAFVYWNFTATGIANDFTYVAAPDTANYLLTSMKVKNTSAGIPLSVTGGYGRSATTGLSSDIIDTTGGYIFLAPDHVVPYATSGSYAITGDISTVLTAVGNVPSGVRTELTTELTRIDVATSTRLATAGYTAPTTPPTAAAIATEVLSAATAAPIKAEVKSINGVTLQGSGTTLDPMRPV